MKSLALIVEDEEDIAELYGHLLHLLGYETIVCTDSEQALAQLRASEPRLVILDLRLGIETGGLDVLNYIRSEPRLSESKVVVISGYPRLAEDIGEAADFVLMKPIDMRQITELVLRQARPLLA